MENFRKNFIPVVATLVALFVFLTQGSMVAAIIIWYVVDFILRLPIYGFLSLFALASFEGP
ncbi:hypothetical protein ACFLR3_00825 [Campylobacterota bacterium]